MVSADFAVNAPALTSYGEHLQFFLKILLQSHLLLMYVFLSRGRVVPDSIHVPHSPKLRPDLSI